MKLDLVKIIRARSVHGLLPAHNALLLAITSLLLVGLANGQTSYVWTGGQGDWETSSNWTPNGIPGVQDSVRISGSDFAVRVRVTDDVEVAAVELDGGRLTPDSTFTVGHELRWLGGTIGRVTFTATPTIIIPESATFRIAGSDEHRLDGMNFLVHGDLLWEDDGGLRLQNPTVLNITETGHFMITGSGSLTRADGIFDLIVDGTMTKEGTAPNNFFYGFGTLVVNGTLNVEAGQLTFANAASAFGTSGTGTIDVAAGAVLRFFSSDFSFDVESTLTGAGTLEAGSNALLVFGSASFAGAVNVTGGQMLFSDPARPANVGRTSVSAGALGSLANDVTININDSLLWSGGSLGHHQHSSDINLLGHGRILGNDTKRLQRVNVHIATPVAWSDSGNIDVFGNGTVHIAEGGALDILTDADITRSSGFAPIVNDGLIAKRGAGGETSVAIPFASFNNNGEVRVETGSLAIAVFSTGSASIDTGAYFVADGARLRFLNHERTFEPSATLSGDGSFSLAPTTTNHGTISPGQSPGLLTHDGDYPKPEPDAVLAVEIGGTEAGTDFDQLYVTGVANLGGVLRVAAADGYTPNDGDRFLVVVADSGVVGTFENIDLIGGLQASVEYGTHGVEIVVATSVGVEDPVEANADLPVAFQVHAPYPNPTSTSFTLKVALPTAAQVSVEVFDVLGRKVIGSAPAERAAGTHSIAMDVHRLGAGAYIVRTLAGEHVDARLLTVR